MPRRAAHEAAVALPDTVTVAIAELAGELEEGLLAFVVGTGLKVLDVVLESEATALAGRAGPPRPGAHRGAPRHRRRARDARGPPGADHASPAAQRRPIGRGAAADLPAGVVDRAART